MERLMESKVRTVPGRAPGSLASVQDFLNTLDVEEGTDQLDDAGAAGAWLADQGYRSSPPTDGELDRLRSLRAVLRALAAGAGPEPAMRKAFAAAAGQAAYLPELRADGTVGFGVGQGGAEAFIGQLVVAVHEAQREDTFVRLKICREHSCSWAFYDSSRNRSGTWCAMGVCGNRAKVARHRQRQQNRPD